MNNKLIRSVLTCGVVTAAGLAGATPTNAASPAATAASVPATCNGIPVTIFGTDGNDTITGTDDNDVIATGDGNDVVFGLGAQDTVCLGQGNDRFVGGPGTDEFVAESVVDGSDIFESDGSDVVSYKARTTAVNVTLDGVANDGQAGEFDNMGTAAVIVEGGSGNDVLNVEFAGAHGGPGDDRLTSRRFLFGEAGNDTLVHVGGLRADDMEGGDGNDRMIDKGTGGSSMQGGNGNDVLIAGSGIFGAFMTGGAGNDNITGSPVRDFINGDDGNDLLIGGLGDDVVSGNVGDDRYLAGVALDGNDTFDGGDGNDTTDFQKRDNLSRGSVLSLSAGGVAGNDGEPGETDTMTAENIRGGTGQNVINGDAGRNRLEGGPSDDVINSIDGVGRNDVIIGNGGNDTCQFDAGPPPDDVRC